MDFQLDSTQLELQSSLRKYLVNEVAPIVNDYEAQAKTVPRDLVRQMSDFGLLGGCLAQEVGGYGLSMTTYGMLINEVARVWPSLRSIISTNNLAASVLTDGGSVDLRQRYLPRILSGEAIVSFALSEPNIGSDAAHVQTKAVKVEAGWRINGRKMYISLGSICDFGVVFVRTQNPDGSDGVSCFLFERSMPGFSSTELPKMGMHSCPLGELLFDDVFIPDENLIGRVGGAFAIAKTYLNIGRSVVAFSALGIIEAAYDAAVNYAKEREQFGRKIAGFQLVQQMIADMMTMFETSRLLCYRAADAIDRQDPDSQRLCSMAKRYATDSVLRVAELSLQVHGGAGYTSLFPVERYYRDARHLSIGEGTNQLQSLLMAQSVLGISAISR